LLALLVVRHNFHVSRIRVKRHAATYTAYRSVNLSKCWCGASTLLTIHSFVSSDQILFGLNRYQRCYISLCK